MSNKQWGKKATGRLPTDRKLEDDELFKQIGGQLDASKFDYTKWQRSNANVTTSSTNKSLAADVTFHEPLAVLIGKPSIHGGNSHTTVAGKKKAAPSVNPTCHHGHRQEGAKKSVHAAYEEAQQKKKAEQLKILQLRIQTRRQTIAEYRRREAELLLSNMKLQEEISNDEKLAHEEVKRLLRKYEKFRGGISSLNDQFSQELSDTRDNLEKTDTKIQEDISDLQNAVDEADARLQEEQSKITMLMNYKDKEYPVKALRVYELQQEIGKLNVNDQEEESELQHIVESEIEKFKREENKIHRDITERATEDVIRKMHPSIRDMAMQNIVMEKEIGFHVKELEELIDTNKALELEVKTLIRDPKTSIRQQMFPEFYPKREKCTPDMDIFLDIPTQEWLPI